MLSRTRGPAVTKGSPTATWMASPSKAGRTAVTAKSSASTAKLAPRLLAGQDQGTDRLTQRSSNFCRTLATSGSRTDWAHRSSQSSPRSWLGSPSSSTRKVHATKFLEPPGGAGDAAIPLGASSYQASSA